MYQFPNKIALSHISADFFHTFKVVTAAHKEKIKIRHQPLPLRPSLTSGLPFTFITKEPEMFLSHGKASDGYRGFCTSNALFAGSPQTELCKDIETPSVAGNKHNYAKVGRRRRRRGMVPCTPLFSYPSGIRKARLERKSQQLWINQPNSSAMTYSLYARARENASNSFVCIQPLFKIEQIKRFTMAVAKDFLKDLLTSLLWAEAPPVRSKAVLHSKSDLRGLESVHIR